MKPEILESAREPPKPNITAQKLKWEGNKSDLETLTHNLRVMYERAHEAITDPKSTAKRFDLLEANA